MKIKLSNYLTLTNPAEVLTRKIRSTFTIENPAWLDNQKMNRWNNQTDRYLTLLESHNGTLSVPRGALGLILWFCKVNIRYELEDNRRILPQVDFTFNGILKGYQVQAVNDLLSRDSGVLQAPTGSGKTVMALAVVAERKQPTLIIVHNKELLSQWIDRITTFLGIPKDEIESSAMASIGSVKRSQSVLSTAFTLSPMTSNSILDILLWTSITGHLHEHSPRLYLLF